MTDDPKFELPIASPVVEPSDYSPEGLRAWLLEVCRYLGITPTELARAARLAASTLNRFLRADPDSDASLSGRTIEGLLKTARSIDERQSKQHKSDPSPGNSRLGDPRLSGLGDPRISDRPYLTNVGVLGRAGLQLIEETEPLIYSPPLYSLKLPIPREYLNRGLGGFEVIDDHAAPQYPRGSIVVVSNSGATTSLAFRDDITAADFTFDDQEDIVSIAWPKQADGVRRNQISIRKFAISPGGDAWLLWLNRSLTTNHQDEPVQWRNSGLFRIIGSYQPVMRKKALA